MKNNITEKMYKTFEDYVHYVDGMEVWFARELQGLLEYSEWRSFYSVIEKAKKACKNSGCIIEDHFVDVNKMVKIGSGAKKGIDDIMLNRYACYLITQNGDPRKEVIAFAQTYFAVQTRKQELIEKRLEEIERLEARQKLGETEKFLSSVIYEKGIDEKGFGRIRSKGDKALFGYSTPEMKDKLGMSQSRALADFLPTITIKAKDFANEITAFNVKQHNLNNEEKITDEHIRNNKDVRKVLVDRDIYPEKLPPEEDIKKIERRLSSETKKISKNVQKIDFS